MKHNQRKWIGIFALLIAVAVMAAFTLRGGDKPMYTTQAVQQGDIRQLVQATGTIDAVTTVQVGSQVSGTVSKLNADFNTRVKKGQVIAEIDPALFQGALLQAQADLQNAQATAAAAKAELLKAQATATQAQKAYDRSNAAFAAAAVACAFCKSACACNSAPWKRAGSISAITCPFFTRVLKSALSFETVPETCEPTWTVVTASIVPVACTSWRMSPCCTACVVYIGLSPPRRVNAAITATAINSAKIPIHFR